MNAPRAALFDLDDTLAESFKPPTQSMQDKLMQLLLKMPVAIITAAGFERVHRDVASRLEDSPHVQNLYLLLNSAAQAYTWKDGWNEEYSIVMTRDERHAIRAAIEELAEDPDPRALILDKEVEIAYAALGLEPSLEEKKAWDPDRSKRMRLMQALQDRVPGFEIRIGGMTTIDITKKGVNKAYGVQWLSEKLNIPVSEMLYVGDALYEGGNDAVVISTGVRTHAVNSPADTEIVIDEILNG